MNTFLKPLIHTLIVSLLPMATWGGPVNINTADAPTLAAELNGVGMTKAQAIIDDRKRRGDFKNASDLARVKGIGERIVEMNKANIRVADPE